MRRIAIVAAGLLALAGCGGHAAADRGTASPTPPVTVTTTGAPASTATASASPTFTGPAGGPVPAGFQPVSVSFVSPDEGFVMGTTADCSGSSCIDMVRTTDGGRSWVGITAPRTDYGSAGGGVSTVRFLDTRDGFAFGSQLWATHDGGASWHQITAIPAEDKIEEGEAAGGFLYVRAGATYRFAATSDTPVLISPGGYDLEPAGATVVGNGGDAGDPLVQFTPSGSARTFAPPATGSGQGCRPAGSSSTDLVAVCGGSVSMGAMGTRSFWGSTDAGAHWTRLGDPGVGAGYLTDGVAVTTTEHAAIATGSGGGAGLLVTTDGGTRWATTLRLAAEDGEQLSDLGFTTSTQGVAIFAALDAGAPPTSGDTARPTLYLTRDGGVSWSAVAF